jgi:hypothetical protein
MGACCGKGGLFGGGGAEAEADDPSSYLTAEEMEGDRDVEATMESSTLHNVRARASSVHSPSPSHHPSVPTGDAIPSPLRSGPAPTRP